MATPTQLNLPQFLETHYDGLINHPKSTLKAYYSRPDVEDRILTVYTRALKETVPKTAIGGGIVGFGISRFLGLGVIGSILMTMQGMGVGAGAGVAWETKRLAVNVRLDASYLAWKDSIEKPIFDSFQTVLDTYEPFEDLRCGINLDFPKVAVRDRFNRLYDQEAIYEWIDLHGTNPVTRERMTREDVTFDMDYARALQIAMDAAFGSADFARINTDNPEEVIEGLKTALRTIVLNHNEIVWDRAQQVLNRATDSGMGLAEARQLYLANTAAYVDMPEELKPKGLLAIVTAESHQELRKALQEEMCLAVNAVASKVLNTSENLAPQAMLPNLTTQTMLQEVIVDENSSAIDVNEEEGDLLDRAVRVYVEGRPEIIVDENPPAIDVNEEEGDLLDQAVRVFAANRPDVYPEVDDVEESNSRQLEERPDIYDVEEGDSRQLEEDIPFEADLNEEEELLESVFMEEQSDVSDVEEDDSWLLEEGDNTAALEEG